MAEVKRNSYAASIIEKKYETYFGNAVCLRKLYRKYYKKEFLAFNTFLAQKFCLLPNQISIFPTDKIFYSKQPYSAMYDFADIQDSGYDFNILGTLTIKFLEKYSR